MMSAYDEWLAAGKPYSTAYPVAGLRDRLRSQGFTVYDYPDDRHLQAVPPEDHTPFSATGWPVASKRWIGHAIDIMPGGPVDLTVLARQIIADKDADVPGTEWIKYINWTDEAGNCWHTSWQPYKTTVSSSDKGHNHISGRSDMDTVVSNYDPVGRVLGDMEQSELLTMKTAYARRTVGNVLGDVSNLRDWEMGTEDGTGTIPASVAPPAANARIALLHNRVKQLTDFAAQLKAQQADIMAELQDMRAQLNNSATTVTPQQIAAAVADEIKARLAE